MNRYLKELKYQLRYGLPVWFSMLICSWMPDISPIIKLRGGLVSLFLPGRPKGLTLARDVSLLSIDRLELGDRVYLAKGVWINAIGGINIEDEVVVAPYVVMSSNNHGFKNNSVKQGGAHPAPISIGHGTWIAAHSVVAAGVNVGRGNLIAANSVVTKNTDDNGVYAGVPAIKIKNRVDNPSSIQSKHDVGR
ncbi:acyltransferase [Alloalcanivorax xenomutans]|uniref:acyltransferase n=1 Tax=Alloalcanivorax xenomutans TaxID=1094342 RepID=UPI00292CB3CD|nr:acyltransferase [Alloalcanivorax xenomutans]WOA33080.1 acyltransferase [Alloalcanivorax xenomutans]